MQILLISRCLPYPLHLGDRLIVYHLARELSKRGHEIDLLAFADPARPADHDLSERAHYEAFFRRITVIDEPRRSPLSLLRRWLDPGARFPRRANHAWSPEMWQAIEQHRRDHDYDVAHLFGGVQVYEYRHALGDLPAIITPYESFTLYLRRLIEAQPARSLSGFSLRVQRMIAAAYEGWMFAPYRQTVVLAERDRAELLALNPALPVTVIPNGVDLKAFKSHNTDRTEGMLLFTGNFEYAPNIDAALHLARDIWPQVRARVQGVTLWLVGNAPPPELQALHGGDLYVTGHVPDVSLYLEMTAAFVCPLRFGAGIKNKVLEALAMGCPVVATPLSVDGIDLVDGQHALVVEDDAFADAIVRLIQDAELQRRLSQQGRELIETKYNWAQVAEQYERLYRSVSG